MNYYQLLQKTELPTPEQCKNFAQGFCGFHSWYKHLNLLKGNRFIFFINSNVAEGFDENNKRLHYGWKTTKEYRANFGLIDYIEEESKDTIEINDSGIRLPDEIMTKASVTLFPFVSTDFNAIESIGYELHRENLKSIYRHTGYPYKELVIRWDQLYTQNDHVWQMLSDDEMEIISGIENKVLSKEHLPQRVEEFLNTQEELYRVYNSLQKGEQDKIEQTLYALIEIIKKNLK